MKKSITFLTAAFCFCFTGTMLHAQENLLDYAKMQSQILHYAVTKTSEPILIDGDDSESSWNKAQWTSSFIDIEGASKSKPLYDSKVKMLWDEEHLYIYALMEEPHIWADLINHDDIIYHNNDFEVFLKPYPMQAFYYEIEVNPLNTVMDLMMAKPYRHGGEAIMHWDVKGLRSAVRIKGTLNDPSDKDQYWTVEMAIPFKALSTYGRNATPKLNEHWRINFSRVQWQHQLRDNTYERLQYNNKLQPEDNWVWSPIGLVNMHYPERWGYLQFVNTHLDEIQKPTYANLETAAWNLHYLQRLFKMDHQVFASDIKELQSHFPSLKLPVETYASYFFTNNAKTFYQIKLTDTQENISFSIDSHGYYKIDYE